MQHAPATSLSRTLAVIMASVALLLGCQPAAAPAKPAPAPPAAQPGASTMSAQWERVVAEARKEGSVRVVLPPLPQLGPPLTKVLEDEYGIRLDASFEAGAEALARVQQESAAGKNTTDVLVGGPQEFLTLYPAGLLEPIKDKLLLPEVTDLSKWADGHIKWADNAQQYFLQTADWVQMDLMVNTRHIDPKSITSWKDLLKPEYKGKIVAQDPLVGSGRGTSRYLLEIFGPDFLKPLYHDQEVTLSRDNRQVVEMLARGTHPIALATTQAYVEAFRQQGFPLERVFPADGPGPKVAGFSLVKLVKNAPHPNAAIVFLNILASKRGQEIYAEVMLEPSRRVDVNVPAVPDYVMLKPGINYKDNSAEDYYVNYASQSDKQVAELFGR